MHNDSRSPSRENQEELLRREQELRLEVTTAELRASLSEYRVAMLELYLGAGPELQKMLAETFLQDTGEPLISPSIPPSIPNQKGKILVLPEWLRLPQAEPKSKCRRRQRDQTDRYRDITQFLHHWTKCSLNKILKPEKKSSKKD